MNINKNKQDVKLGPCLIQTFGTISDHSFHAYVWLESNLTEFSATIKVKLRLTKINEKSQLIKTWKDDLCSSDTPQLTLGIEIVHPKNPPLIVTSVYPEKVEGRYLYLAARANRLGEIWGIL